MTSACLVPSVLAPATQSAVAATRTAASHAAGQTREATGGTIAAVDVSGNQRIDASTIRSYILLQPGDAFSARRMDLSLKTLYATGLFKTVSITRQGNDLMVKVKENPIVNQVFFEGNSVVKDKDMKGAIALKPGSVFTAGDAATATKAILGLYAKRGHYSTTVVPEIVKLPENRVNVVFKCHDGTQTLISRINFIGNHEYGQGKLREVISSRQDAWYRFLSDSDQYNSERVKYDESLLSRFYFHHGYADFKIVSATAQLAPNRKSFYLTFVVDEGPRYRIGSVQVVSSLRKLPGKQLRPLVPIEKGDIFDGDALQAADKSISTYVQDRGFAFAQVEPDVKENHKDHTIALTFRVIEGPRVYVDNVSISGNTRTEDSVIRREIELAPGDAYNEQAVKQSKDNLENLGFFKKKDISIKPVPTQQPDRVNLDVGIGEQANGQFSLGGGYSTDLGALVNVGLSQSDFLGTGIEASISALLAQKGTQFNLGVTNPYFLGRNLIAGFDLFRTDTANTTSYVFSERSIGGDLRLGFRYNQHVSQAFTYTISTRDIYNIATGASLYILNEQGSSSLSQLGTTLTFDYRNDRLDPTSGGLLSLSGDFAGLGGSAKYVRLQARGAYYIPLARYFGSKAWVLEFDGHVGDLVDILGYKSLIADRFFLGGDSLLGFQTGGAGPHDTLYGDSLGGKFIYTQDTVLHFPLPVSPDLGVSGFAFTDIGSLSGVSPISVNGKALGLYDNAAPRISAGIGVAWNTPFGLIDLSFAQPIKKYKYDQIEQFRVSFGTRF
ncbi:MAG: outer membrane protein assembly factor BamA [Acidiphilium sp. 37-64-53]|nr:MULTISPECIES: outer membrane protein assembly factor BamA [Acidiphilium]OYW01246.1 MAG: outer membrane protein assembly factor BamA [Acidiphilium sp. 37-64-53]OZB28865.1 MAG: outer membrane protein assembly factor BamA [Acidiphilium sp. 34-64-41]HQT86066.1 outer membrane protein assembly factor BamA [Acidiphilium rubrum]